MAPIAGRRRLLAATAAPAAIAEDDVVASLATRLLAADPGLAAELADLLGADGAAIARSSGAGPARLRVATAVAPTLALLAGSPRALEIARRTVAGTGWRITAATPESHDPRDVTALLLRPDVRAAILMAGDPPGADERSSVADLTALTAAARVRRPDLPVVLAGGMAAGRRRFDRLGLDEVETAPLVIVAAERLGDASAAVRRALEELRAPDGDGRTRIAAGAAALADALGRRIEVIDIGFNGGLRALATPGVGGSGASLLAVASADAALVPDEPDETAVERLAPWLSGPSDRQRALDRLIDLRASPWSDATPWGARLRLAATAAALERLIACTDEVSAEPPADLIVLSGGGFAAGPPAAVALTVADVLRRPGGIQVALDHARLLGPIGAVADPTERRRLAAELADDLLLPLGSIVVLDTDGRSAASPNAIVRLTANGLDLPFEVGRGTVEQVDLAPGTSAVATVEWPTARGERRRGRRLAIPVSGGLAGLIVDGRGVPLRLPAASSDRRAALAAWHDPLWSTAS